MTIRIYLQDRHFADAASQPDGSIQLSGPSAGAYETTLEHYRETTGLDGDELLGYLLEKYARSSTWSAEEIQ